MTRADEGRTDRRCPVCGRGTLADIDFGGAELFQHPESRQVDVYTCGHEVELARLETADADRLDVERRTAEETATPTPTEGTPGSSPLSGAADGPAPARDSPAATG